MRKRILVLAVLLQLLPVSVFAGSVDGVVTSPAGPGPVVTGGGGGVTPS